jgi:hypothetical protein
MIRSCDKAVYSTLVTACVLGIVRVPLCLCLYSSDSVRRQRIICLECYSVLYCYRRQQHARYGSVQFRPSALDGRREVVAGLCWDVNGKWNPL